MAGKKQRCALGARYGARRFERLMLRHLLQLCVVMIIRCAPLEPTIAIASLPLGAGLQCEMAYLCLARSERWLLRLRRWHSVDLLGRSMCRRSRGSHLSDRAEHSVLILHAVGHPSVGNRLAGKVGMIVVVVAMH